MNNGRIDQTRGASRDVIKILGKRVCANREDRWQKPQNSGVLRRESPPVLVAWGEGKSVQGLFFYSWELLPLGGYYYQAEKMSAL